MFNWLKTEWNKKGCFYKVVRTFLQTFAVALMTEITAVLSGVMEISWQMVLTVVLIPSISAGITAAINKLSGKDCKATENDESEGVKNE
ncbi:MAG: hypothetical protein IJZ94_05770 [Clostridia bacterium]|nr:hypothetical protein [Clostridia bacterium]